MYAVLLVAPHTALRLLLFSLQVLDYVLLWFACGVETEVYVVCVSSYWLSIALCLLSALIIHNHLFEFCRSPTLHLCIVYIFM